MGPVDEVQHNGLQHLVAAEFQKLFMEPCICLGPSVEVVNGKRLVHVRSRLFQAA